MNLRSPGLVSAAIATFFVVGCSSSPSPAPTGSPSPTPTAAGTTPTPAASTPSATTPQAAGGGACAAETTEDSCGTCCDTKNPQGVAKATALEDARMKCVCTACATECAQTMCSANYTEPPAGSPCDTCVASKGAQCDEQAETACSADPSCAALSDCYENSQCDSKP